MAPTMMKRITPEMPAVPSRAFSKPSQVSARYIAATSTVATAPMAADSVGVAQPAAMARITTTKMMTSGITYTTSGPPADPAADRRVLEGGREPSDRARCGRRYSPRRTRRGARRARCPRGGAARWRCRPGCPRSTVSAEGGISMSTPADGHDGAHRHARADSRAGASREAGGCPGARWWRWWSRRSPRTPSPPPPPPPRAARGRAR